MMSIVKSRNQTLKSTVATMELRFFTPSMLSAVLDPFLPVTLVGNLSLPGLKPQTCSNLWNVLIIGMQTLICSNPWNQPNGQVLLSLNFSHYGTFL